MWPLSEVSRVGRIRERDRFLDPIEPSARKSALRASGLTKEVIFEGGGSESVARLMENIPDESCEQSWISDPRFEEIPAHLLHKDMWAPKLWGRWSWEGDIGELESRALVKSMRRVCHVRWGRDLRQLFLVDNLGVCLSFNRFRSGSLRVLKQVRVFAAYCLTKNIRSSVRWIPSEFNSADEGSREVGESKVLTHILPKHRVDFRGGDLEREPNLFSNSAASILPTIDEDV